MCVIRKVKNSTAMAATFHSPDTPETAAEKSNCDRVEESRVENRIKKCDTIKTCPAGVESSAAEGEDGDSPSPSQINNCHKNEKTLNDYSDSHDYVNDDINLKCDSLNQVLLRENSVSEIKGIDLSSQNSRESRKSGNKSDFMAVVETSDSEIEDDYFKPLKKLKMIQNLSSKLSSSPSTLIKTDIKIASQRVKTFSISEILSTNSSKSQCNDHNTQDINRLSLIVPSSSSRFIRPWDTDEEDHEVMSVSSSSSCSPRPASSGPVLEPSSRDKSLSTQAKGGGTPLDELFKMTSKTLIGLKSAGEAVGEVPLFGNKQSLKKKRKCRTAFTNHQIFELEKRFLYQKYLSPADRDELAQGLGLSNAQVITWFQNRRAKLKRDLEELKTDARTASLLGNQSVFLQTISRMGLLKTKSDMELSFINCKK